MQHRERSWKLALIDLDGTLFRGTEVIPGAVEFVNRIRQRDIRPVFFTNNATRTPTQVVNKLRTMGIAANADEVCTSAQASADWLLRQCGPTASIAYIGTDGLSAALTEANLSARHVRELDDKSDAQPVFDAAVMGLDPLVTYANLTTFCQIVSEIGGFVLTNADARLPVGSWFAPGNGALGSFVSTATGLEPMVIGKPETVFVHYALSRYDAGPEDAILIGDNVLTDILAGRNSGVYTIQVRTGVSVATDIAADEVWLSVADLF